jgi:asparagine synthase (glutamine-hydrolysing)
MCAICGIVYEDRTRPVDEHLVTRMRDVMTHRGPDDAGLFLGPGIGLGSRRLAILDLSPRGHMPMHTRDGRYGIVYNGEIYNYRELRRELVSRGHKFASNTDTEVLLNLYADQGANMLDRLDGMFAFAIWDRLEQTLFLGRDHVGIKPLYYAQTNEAFYFASEEKALFAAGVPASFDVDTWEELLCFRYVAGERTPFTGVRRLLPGASLLLRNGRTQTHRWWRLADRARETKEKIQPNPVGWLQHTFDDSVDRRRISDVPVGVLLSGGLDSGCVAASLAAQSESKVAAFTVRFSEPQFDEGELARAVVQKWNLEGHELIVTPESLAERFHSGSWLADEPLAHGSDLHLWAIAEHAKPRVTVLLSGEGADELMGGYVRYQPLRFARLLGAGQRLLPSVATQLPLTGRTRKLARLLTIGTTRDAVLYNACEVVPDDLRALGMTASRTHPYREACLQEAIDLYGGDLPRQAMYVDQHTFLCSLLDRNDRMTMGASIECRVPFLDHRLVAGFAALPSAVLKPGQRKPLLRQAFGNRLPPAVLGHRKWGFAVPWNQYLLTVPALRAFVHDLPNVEPVVSGPFDRRMVRQLVNDFLGGKPEHALLVRQLLAIAAWHDASVQAVRTPAHFLRRQLSVLEPDGHGHNTHAALRLASQRASL